MRPIRMSSTIGSLVDRALSTVTVLAGQQPRSYSATDRRLGSTGAVSSSVDVAVKSQQATLPIAEHEQHSCPAEPRTDRDVMPRSTVEPRMGDTTRSKRMAAMRPTPAEDLRTWP